MGEKWSRDKSTIFEIMIVLYTRIFNQNEHQPGRVDVCRRNVGEKVCMQSERDGMEYCLRSALQLIVP